MLGRLVVNRACLEERKIGIYVCACSELVSTRKYSLISVDNDEKQPEEM